MSAIVAAVLKASIGALVTKSRKEVSERLRKGDVADKKLRDIIVREMDEVKSKLDGLSRQFLLTAIDKFKEGIVHLYQAKNAQCIGPSVASSAASEPEAAALDGATGLLSMEQVELSDTVKMLLSEAKQCFKLADEKASEASNNEALSTIDRVNAIRYRVVAIMLKSAITIALVAGEKSSSVSVKTVFEGALNVCEQCLEKLHSLLEVQNNFKVELDRGLLNVRGRIGKEERREIISVVCLINRAVYDAAQTIGKDVLILPGIDCGGDILDPLRDVRVAKILHKVGMGDCFVPQSIFVDNTQQLRMPSRIVSTPDGNFLIVDFRAVKVFERHGNCPLKIDHFISNVVDAATDVQGNIYVLFHANVTVCGQMFPSSASGAVCSSASGAVGISSASGAVGILPGSVVGIVSQGITKIFSGIFGSSNPGQGVKSNADVCQSFVEVQVYNSTGELQQKFPLESGDRLAVSGSKVMVLSCDGVDVYQHDGRHSGGFSEGMSSKLLDDIAVTSDGRIVILNDSSVCVFTEKGKRLSRFHLPEKNIRWRCLDYHASGRAGEFVVLAGCDSSGQYVYVAVHTLDGKRVKLIQAGTAEGTRVVCKGIAVTTDGHIALLYCIRDKPEVLML